MNDSQASIFPNRRRMLGRLACGAGLLGLAGIVQRNALMAANPAESAAPNLVPRAKRVIFLFLNGGPSQIDMFDHKPFLEEVAGEKFDGDAERPGGLYMPSPFAFARHGESGIELSELLPTLAGHADDLCVIRSMHTDIPNHDPALLQMLTGASREVRPALGAWALYGLGTENENLPGFLALRSGGVRDEAALRRGGPLPAKFQGAGVLTDSMDIEKLIRNIRSTKYTLREQREQLDMLDVLNRHHLEFNPGDALLEAEIHAMETAYRMQIEATDAFDIGQEPKQTREMYGDTRFGESCLLARRLAERGVRFTVVYYAGQRSAGSWDTHGQHNRSMKILCADADRAAGALIGDLKRRGLLEDTLVVMGGEFGRPPYGEGRNLAEGRGHQSSAFSMMLAGGGVRGGTTYGVTDERGIEIAENPVSIAGLHSTVLHLLGIDPKELGYHRGGRHFTLNNGEGRVVRDVVG